jgi:hypothetical protein
MKHFPRWAISDWVTMLELTLFVLLAAGKDPPALIP